MQTVNLVSLFLSIFQPLKLDINFVSILPPSAQGLGPYSIHLSPAFCGRPYVCPMLVNTVRKYKSNSNSLLVLCEIPSIKRKIIYL